MRREIAWEERANHDEKEARQNAGLAWSAGTARPLSPLMLMSRSVGLHASEPNGTRLKAQAIPSQPLCQSFEVADSTALLPSIFCNRIYILGELPCSERRAERIAPRCSGNSTTRRFWKRRRNNISKVPFKRVRSCRNAQ